MFNLPAVGQEIGRYRIESEVGRGAMGVVYRTFDPVLKRPVAIKLLAPHLGSDPNSLTRFNREASLVASLKHTNIASVYEFGEHDGHPYIAMEWLEGRTLKQLLQTDGALPYERALKFVDQLASALDYAHENGVIHRDLKPSNIVVSHRDLLTIVDFGLAFMDDGSSLTQTGSVLGTPLYMSPEQIKGMPLDGRSDQYNLGLILFEMLAGQPPFGTPQTQAIFHQHIYGLPPSISEIKPDLPSQVESTITTALSKEPDERFGSASELSQSLRALPMVVTPQAVVLEPEKAIATNNRPNWLPWAAGLLLLIGGFMGGMLLPDLLADEADPTPVTTTESLVSAEIENADSTSTQEESVAESEPDSADSSAAPPADATWVQAKKYGFHMSFGQDNLELVSDEPRWQAFPDNSEFNIVAANGIVVVVDGETVYGLDWATGAVVWETNLGVEISSQPAIFNGWDGAVVVLTTFEGGVVGLNLDDAGLRWRMLAEQFNGIAQGHVVVGDDSVIYFVTDEGYLYGVDPYQSSVQLEVEINPDDEFLLAPTLTDFAAYVLAESGTVYVIDTAAQEVAWTHEYDVEVTTLPLVHSGWGYFIAGTESGVIEARSLVGGTIVWETETDGAIVSLAADWSNVYVLTDQNTLYSFSAEGEQIWRVITPETVEEDLVVTYSYALATTVEGNILFFSLVDGQLDEDASLYIFYPDLKSPIVLGGWLMVNDGTDVAAFPPR